MKLCNIHGTYQGERCTKCRASANKVYDKVFRDQSVKKFYDSAQWKKIRAMQLRQEPICYICNAIATHVDHDVEIKDGGSKTDMENLKSMCLPCHNRKTNRTKKQRGGGVKSLQNKTPTTERPSQILQTPCEGGRV